MIAFPLIAIVVCGILGTVIGTVTAIQAPFYYLPNEYHFDGTPSNFVSFVNTYGSHSPHVKIKSHYSSSYNNTLRKTNCR